MLLNSNLRLIFRRVLIHVYIKHGIRENGLDHLQTRYIEIGDESGEVSAIFD